MNEILSYYEVCNREGRNLQRGMHFQSGFDYSVILMSVRPNAPYRDRFEDERTLVYEGHNAARHGNLDPYTLDQPEFLPSGNRTENGKFHKAAQDYAKGLRPAERVRVYEKIKEGIWSYNGVFELVDSWQESDGTRRVFKFKLVAIDEPEGANAERELGERQRLIPTAVKLAVWKRDRGRCVMCGSTDELHFDHIIPFSKGGTSLEAKNIQLLCARHNLAKRDKIE